MTLENALYDYLQTSDISFRLMKPDATRESATATEPAAAQPAVNKERGQRQVCTGLYTPPMGSKVHEVTLDLRLDATDRTWDWQRFT